MHPGDGEFLTTMNFSFCPRIGEFIEYTGKEYIVEKVTHTHVGTILTVSES